ncbi:MULTISPECIES: sigma-70 family RNA polymerase sigma factor [unclassified Streptomyces]|uniref:RNA polymerase sigma factor n=1 Tax=unclassified Streptomyces TaxID=2593676 RepID=UPI002365937A|nr:MULTISPECIES: sigma-70 family RNA polymerase sigma factor [unclassified Streptomyces]MDF3143720.1 sigma-70 family RNA polymerase sigma factor [Streptomyces sp. T21Q-yed]WDF38862.1 sigma-70 family RNA polymerase sigma factor [Streptomyces sp. T12]
MTELRTTRNPEARFEALAHVVVEPLHRYLVRRADADMVDDVLSETLLVLWRRLDDVPGLGSGPAIDPDDVLPWCYGVARGCLANARRADSRRLRLVERLTRTREALPTAPPDHSDLHAALDKLSVLDREVVLLWAWEELAPLQIAEVTGMTSNAVSIRLHRAKKKLAGLLERKNSTPAGHETSEGRSSR